MRGILPAIRSREGVASIYLFPNQIFFELVNRNQGAYRRYSRKNEERQPNIYLFHNQIFFELVNRNEGA